LIIIQYINGDLKINFFKKQAVDSLHLAPAAGTCSEMKGQRQLRQLRHKPDCGAIFFSRPPLERRIRNLLIKKMLYEYNKKKNASACR
jgi:hypothetical protein